MSTDLQTQEKTNLPAIAGTRLPYHPGLQQRFGIDQTAWRALVESTFPTARSTEAIILALAYCRARNLDVFKRVVHIVPIWDKNKGREVETVWPGIAEYRTTAFRTGQYAGHDDVVHGPMITHKWPEGDGTVEISFPEWAQFTVYRMIGGNKCKFPGPQVYWLETYSAKKNSVPNTMWADRPIGMIDKCAEAAALRSAFPEELGEEWSADEAGGFMWRGNPAIETPKKESLESQAGAMLEAAANTQSQPEVAADVPAEPQQSEAPVEPPTESPAASTTLADKYKTWLEGMATDGKLTEEQIGQVNTAIDEEQNITGAERLALRDLLNPYLPREKRTKKNGGKLFDNTPRP